MQDKGTNNTGVKAGRNLTASQVNQRVTSKNRGHVVITKNKDGTFNIAAKSTAPAKPDKPRQVANAPTYKPASSANRPVNKPTLETKYSGYLTNDAAMERRAARRKKRQERMDYFGNAAFGVNSQDKK